MKCDPGGFAAADHSNHLFKAGVAGRIDQRGEQCRADPLPHCIVCDIDAVLTGMGIGGAIMKLGRISVSDDCSVAFHNQ